MSDGHSDAARYSRFYDTLSAERVYEEQRKLEKMCLVTKDGEVLQLNGIQLLFSNEVNKDLKHASVESLSNDGSRMINLTELIRTLIKSGVV